MKNKIAVFIADGFEEIEAIACIDILRRAEQDVIVVGVGGQIIKGAHGLSVKSDIDIELYNDIADVIILPGGGPGVQNLAKSEKLSSFIKKANKENKLIAAICAAPAYVLAPLGSLDGKKATCYPGCENKLNENTQFKNDDVVIDGNIITSKGPGTAIKFALSIVEKICGKDLARSLAKKLIYEE